MQVYSTREVQPQRKGGSICERVRSTVIHALPDCQSGSRQRQLEAQSDVTDEVIIAAITGIVCLRTRLSLFWIDRNRFVPLFVSGKKQNVLLSLQFKFLQNESDHTSRHCS